MTGSLVAQQAVPAAGEAVLRDKTLVVWAAPANLTQQGGSALTIEDGREHFDAIVFGELAAGKWMAGSDFFKRSLKEQARVPVEVAGGDTFVQIAIAYAGPLVTVYRNGAVYAQHRMAEGAQEFGVGARCTIGKRHRKQSGPEHFAGAIDEARIYDVALSAEQIAALRPNAPSAVKPWAWWTFDDAEAKDRSGRFIVSDLSAGAKIVDGKLVLDGIGGEFTAGTGKEAPFVAETPARPAEVPSNWLSYHLAHPGPGQAMPGDPNCAFFWKGRYHLHYIYNHRDGFSFAHVSSEDMIHWRWHPTTLTPPVTGHGMFSGTGFFTKEGRPAIIYHGEGSGRNQIAFAEDDQLEKWTKPVAMVPKERSGAEAGERQWDPDCWLNGESYYGISGGAPAHLMKSGDLKNWTSLGLLMHPEMRDDLGVKRDEDVSCANMFKIGHKWMLLCISHQLGCRYYLGDFKGEQFLPDFHAMMNWRKWEYFAPESLLTADGRRVMWAWCHLEYPQTGMQSLPRELSLPEDGVLRIKPLRELETLRRDEKRVAGISLPSGVAQPLAGISGDAVELQVSFQPGAAEAFGVEVYCDAAGQQGFPIRLEPAGQKLRLGAMDVPCELLPGKTAELRVFLDKSMIEVFVNDRQAAVASHQYGAGNLGIQLISQGSGAVAREVKAWGMRSIYAEAGKGQ